MMSTSIKTRLTAPESTKGGSTSRSGQMSIRVAKIGIFAAIYVVTSLFPLSVFVGFGESFLTFALIMTPTIAVLLKPEEAFPTAVIGGFIALWAAPQSATFQLFTILLPIAGATAGSLLYHRSKVGGPVSAVLLAGAMAGYLIARPEFPWWVLPHGLALIIAVVVFTLSLQLFSKRISLPVVAQVGLVCFVATMCEQAAMVTLAVYYLALPWPVFLTAFPLMLLERSVATIGSVIITTAVLKAIPNYFTT